MKRSLSFAVVIILVAGSALGQETGTASNPPEDQPFDTDAEQFAKTVEAMQPYVDKARATYPEAKQRFKDGLPPGHTFFVTTQPTDIDGLHEQVFIRVTKIRRGRIWGKIASDIGFVKGYRYDDFYRFPESELLDWLIARPDGSEEGNFVGKFLDEYQKTIQ